MLVTADEGRQAERRGHLIEDRDRGAVAELQRDRVVGMGGITGDPERAVIGRCSEGGLRE